MTLIKNISGFRGTVGGPPKENLTPFDIVTSVSAFCKFLIEKYNTKELIITTGRDGRASGENFHTIVNRTISLMGIDVIDTGLSTTPTLCWGVLTNDSNGGIMITASHNPEEYNGLKFFNEDGEFLSREDMNKVIKYSNSTNFEYQNTMDLGSIKIYDNLIEDHVHEILNLDIIPVEKIRSMDINVVVDGINSGGAIAIPLLLDKLSIKYKLINGEISGKFSHTPEPLAENLTQLSEEVIKHKADFGIAVDPDVDRLVFFDEKGIIFGEEYTQVVCSDYVLSNKKGNTVSTLSSSNAMKDITMKHGCEYFHTAVGEMNVVKKMKEVNAVVGGEGGGGIIYPDLHYGRDALIGTALFLSLLTTTKEKVSEIKKRYSLYFMSKLKIKLSIDLDVDSILSGISEKYSKYNPILIDGVFIDFESSWVHLRKSNTEPIIRIFTESKSKEEADKLAKEFYDIVNSLS
ncbi:MAG: phosphoglucosamine mutase [Bacteroidota bacterium]|nr:phosphoglucosamine mutase [Bacteroidota bacterium]